MYQVNVNNPIHIHFIGIGGISMSGLATLLKKRGFEISGSDRDKNEVTEALKAAGIKVYRGQYAENITDGIDLVVYTAAIHPDNPEYAECVRRGLPMMDRATLLGQLCKFFRRSVGIAGTHGKTTTTSMVACIMLAADADPTVSVGGMLPAIGGNLRIGGEDNFIFEACEYTNSFLKFFPTDVAILNIEEDHLDFFKDLDDIRHSFAEYADIPEEGGHVVINADIRDYKAIVANAKAKVSTYSLNDKSADFSATDVSYDVFGNATFTLLKKGVPDATIKLGVPGEHNVSNALAAIALCEDLGVDIDAVKAGLKSFTGTDRRFQKKGELPGGVTVIDDYAHHPTEISATIHAARMTDIKGRLWVVFQPHTYTRTIALREDFVKALSAADVVVMAKIYAAREADEGIISSDDLCEDLREMGKEAYYLPTFDEIENFLLKNLVNGDLLITMGAGDVVKIGEHLLGE